MKNILVTGAAGFIGSNFVHCLQRERPDVEIWGLDALTYAGNLENLEGLPRPDKFHFVPGNILDKESWHTFIYRRFIDTIVHFAAETHVDRSIKHPQEFVDTNVVGTFKLLEAARQAWQGDITYSLKRFHFVSTDEVYGSLGPNDPPSTEESPYAPRSPYAATKAAADHLVMSYWHTYKLPVTISHGSNTYGPRAYPEKFVPVVILKARNRQPIPIYGDGSNVRQWLHVEDHCSAILKILEAGKVGEIYNVGGEPATNLQVAAILCAHVEHYSESMASWRYPNLFDLVTFVKDRPGHDLRYALDDNKLKDIGWKQTHNLKSGLDTAVQWYLKNSTWVEKIQSDPRYQEWMKTNYQER